MNLQTFIDNHYEDGEVFSEDENISFKCVERGDDVVEHKSVYQTSVYQLVTPECATNEYFEVTENSSNSGYWSDSERYDPDFRKVVPVKKIVEITEWIAV
jgi:hypothetical protein